MNPIFRLLINALVVYLGIRYLPGIHGDSSFWSVMIVALILALLNTFLKPLIVLLTIPATILTFGLFLLIINAAIIMLAAKLLDGFTVDGFWYALLFSVILSFTNSLFGKRDEDYN